MERLCIQGKQNSVVKVRGAGIFNCVNVLKDDDMAPDDVDNKLSEDSYSSGNNSEVKYAEGVLGNGETTANYDDGNEDVEFNGVGGRDSETLRQTHLDLEGKWLKNSIVRNVCILDKQGEEKNISVIIINVGWRKPWCGGYRNVRNKKIYWNAYAQTVFNGAGQIVMWPAQEKLTLSRVTQTHLEYVTRGMNTGHVKQTQTPLIFEEDYQDTIVPFKYTSREELELKKNRVRNAILVIQKWVKRYIAMRDFRKHKELEEKFKALEERRKKEKEKEILIPDPLKMALKPAVSDKSQLYSLERDVIKWKEKELEKIILTKSGPTKYAALYELLDKEVHYLYQYEAVRIKLKEEQIEKRKKKFLQIIASSTNRKAKDLKELYEMYITTEGVEERLELINCLIKKIHTQYIDYEWAEDLKALLSRELAMLRAGYKKKDLMNLQVRTEDLLFNLLACPEFNPLADKYVTKAGKFFHRKGTKIKIQQSSKNQSSFWLENVGKITKNLTPYGMLLRYVRNIEKELTSSSWACWKINTIDMLYLVDIIWNGRSILSETNDIDKLRIVRWDIYLEWSPWNCILLTEDEAILQGEVTDVQEIYDETLIKKVKIKHIIAKMRFKKLYQLYVEKVISAGAEGAGVEETIRSPEG